MPPLLEVDRLTVRFGGLDALGEVSFSVGPREICGLIGPNGSGKTTLLNAVTGIVRPTRGDIRLDGRSLLGLRPNQIAALGVRRTFQNLEIFRRLSVLDNVLVGSHLRVRHGLFGSGLRLPSAVRAEASAVEEARALLALVGLDPVRDTPAADLSFGDQRLLEVVRALAARPRLLLLDEPAAGLSRPKIQELKTLLRRLRSELDLTILLVEHVMALVMDVSERVVVLDSGRLILDGTPAQAQTDERVRRVYLGSALGEGTRTRRRPGGRARPEVRRAVIETDVLVVGGGAAAVRAAIESQSAGARTLLVSKGPIGKSGNTPMAGGGVQAVLDPTDTIELHLRDTLREAGGLGSPALARRLVEEAPARLRDLERYGVLFQRMPDASLRLFSMPGFSRPRNAYVRGGGWGLVSALDRQLGRRGVDVLEDAMLVELVTDGQRVTGAVLVDLLTGRVSGVRARAVVLATGGYEAIWSFTDASSDATGEGTVAAWEAGARLTDLEMVLFYPSVVCHPRALRGMAFYYEFVLSEALAGGRLLNGRGDEFLGGFPVRDRLSRAIAAEVAEGRGTPHGGVWTDLRCSPRSPEELGRLLQQWMPGEFKRQLRLGIDPRTTPLEVYPGVHYCLGGVEIDPECRTSVSGLFAAGEVTGNVHGVNRLAGNALSETQVFGAAAGLAAARAEPG
ncbi:MAG: FAD-binding protein, partial [Candidatus Rokubacteria bacterium]|nr:FAD-binding protein [Candidatus Rokubacteria bacterium]